MDNERLLCVTQPFIFRPPGCPWPGSVPLLLLRPYCNRGPLCPKNNSTASCKVDWLHLGFLTVKPLVPWTDQLTVTLGTGFPQALEGQRAGICVQPIQALKAVPTYRWCVQPGSEGNGDTVTSKRIFPPEGRRTGSNNNAGAVSFFPKPRACCLLLQQLTLASPAWMERMQGPSSTPAREQLPGDTSPQDHDGMAKSGPEQFPV